MNPGVNLEVKQSDYEKYWSAGGFLIEADYANALAEVKARRTVEPHSLSQAEGMAKAAGIVLESREEGIDPRVALYDVLHDMLRVDDRDINRYPLSQLSDQPL